MLNFQVLDGVASLIIGLILAGTAAFLAWECQSLLTGEGASPEVQASIHAIVTAEPAVERPNEILTMHFGPQDVLVALSLSFVESGTAAEVEEAVTRIERQIKAAHPEVTRVFIEAQDREAHSRSQPPLEAMDETGIVTLTSVGRPETTSGYSVSVTQSAKRTSPGAKC